MAPKNQRWWLTEDSESVLIDAPAECIYDLVADMPRMGEWSLECQRVDWTDESDGPVPNATFVGHNRRRPHGAHEVVPARAGAHRGTRDASSRSSPRRAVSEGTVWRYRFEPAANGTRVTESYTVEWIPTWARIVDVPTNRHRELVAAMRHTLQQLKTAAETSITAGDES